MLTQPATSFMTKMTDWTALSSEMTEQVDEETDSSSWPRPLLSTSQVSLNAACRLLNSGAASCESTNMLLRDSSWTPGGGLPSPQRPLLSLLWDEARAQQSLLVSEPSGSWSWSVRVNTLWNKNMNAQHWWTKHIYPHGHKAVG